MYRALLLTLGLLFMVGCSRLSGEATPTVDPSRLPGTVTVAPQVVVPTPTLLPTEIVTRGTVSIWHSWSDEQIATLEQIVADFQALYPEVQFDVLYVPAENLQKRFEVAAQDGTAPDLLLGPAEWGPAFYNAGWLADLTGLIDESISRNISPASLGSARYQDATIGMPYAQQGVVLYRNQAIIPEAPETFDDLINMAKLSTQGEIIGADLERGLFFSGAHLSGIAGNLINPDGTPAFNNEKGLAWLELLRDFEKAGPSEYLSDRDIELFQQGRVGMIIDGTWNMQALADAIGADNLAIDPWPSYQIGGLSGFVRPQNIFLTRGAPGDDQPAAAKFIEYLVSPTAQSRLAEAGMIPVVAGVPIANPLNARLITQAMVALAGGATYPVLPEFALYTGPLEVMLDAVLNKGVAPQEALDTAYQTIMAALAAAASQTPTP